MMPNMAPAIRGFGGRRVTVQKVAQTLVDGEAVQTGQSLMRATVVFNPMSPRKIAIKPEGQRTWKWQTGTSAARFEVGWFLVVDGPDRRQYEVMEAPVSGQARVYVYDLAEAPR